MQVAGGSRSQRGVALAILLWFVAALTLLVGSLALTAKTDSQLSRGFMDKVRAEAAADGAVQLILATSPVEGQQLYQREYRIGALPVKVRAVPVSALISIYDADEVLLNALFEVGAGLDSARAAELTQSVVQWRTQAVDEEQAQRRRVSIQVLEDVLAVPGVTREVFDAIQPFIRPRAGRGGALDITHAPAEVLHVLAAGQQVDLESALEARSTQQPDTLSAVKLSPQPLRVDARVKMASGFVYERSVWVTPGGGATGWQITRRYPVRAVPQLTFDRSDNYGDI